MKNVTLEELIADKSLIGRDVRVIDDDGTQFQGPLASLTLDKGMFILSLDWTALINGSKYTWRNKNPEKLYAQIAHMERMIPIQKNPNGIILIHFPMVGKIIIQSAKNTPLNRNDIK